MENFKVRLSKLQGELKAPKNLHNKFGDFNYRNAEGILEAVKPLLVKYGLLLNVSDDVVLVGDRYYIKAKAIIFDTESQDYISSTACARESLSKKGMDDSQISGTASSYARKYALNGLLLLDDTKDADTDEFHKQGKSASDGGKEKEEEEKFNQKVKEDLEEKATEAQKNAITEICNKHKVRMDDLLSMNQISMETMTKGQATNLIMSLKKKFGDE